ncbi:unnamed protein product [Effrenium voratum]|uniref:Phosphatidylserine decarboxylase n=1 Tax=Effrenium voratum TaxID=2562239 RepID=A0AA36MTE7_9DINO|nr:unnamed protein product [Effrenium voratum]CAJ1428360.1 unnamed protein product [Effrenium voratum]
MGCRASKKTCQLEASKIETGAVPVVEPFRCTRRVLDRKTGKAFVEIIPDPVWALLKGLYTTAACGVVPAHPLRCCLRRLTQHAGRKMRSASTQKDIQKFIDIYRINMDEVLLPVSEFRSMNDFFTRELKPEARPIASPQEPGVFVSCADCRVIIFPSLEEATRLWIKGSKFSLTELLGAAAPPFLKGCSVVIFRLATQDYHRFHFPCGPGKVLQQINMPGEYYSVNPIAINHRKVDVLTENCRVVTTLKHPSFGQVAFAAVGATLIGSVELLAEAGAHFEKGDCFGYFQYGGSTCVVLTEPGAVAWDKDLLEASAHGLETYVKMGERMGVSPSWDNVVSF